MESDTYTGAIGKETQTHTNLTLNNAHFTMTPSNCSMRQAKVSKPRIFSPNATDAFSMITVTNQGNASGLFYKMKAKTNRYKITQRNNRDQHFSESQAF